MNTREKCAGEEKARYSPISALLLSVYLRSLFASSIFSRMINSLSLIPVCEWLFMTMCGISTDGENRFSIKPCPGGHFSFAKAGYTSIYGRVESGWVRGEGGSITYTVTVPANCTAVFEACNICRELGPGTHIIKQEEIV